MSDIDMMSRSDGRMASAASSFTYVPFGFTSKTQYDANESLIQIRSENYSKVEPEKDNDIWKRPPPDFRPQIFAPKPPKRNSRESMKPENFGTYPGTNKPVKRPERTVIPHMLRPKKPDEGRMILRYHIDRPFTAKKKFVTEGMYKAGEFVNPKPHDFRGVSVVLRIRFVFMHSVYYEKSPLRANYMYQCHLHHRDFYFQVTNSVVIHTNYRKSDDTLQDFERCFRMKVL